jgi:hypothetical protein
MAQARKWRLVVQGTVALLWILCLGVWLGVTPGAQARVVRIVVESREPHTETAGAKIPYERIRGFVYGEVDPLDRRNAIIEDIALAPQNPYSRVECAATFTLLKPIDPAPGSGLLLFEVVNRGASILPKDLFKGDIILSSGWQGDLPFRGKSVYGTDGETVQLPIAHNADGSAVTGTVLLLFANVPEGTHSVAAHSAMSYVSSGPPPLPVDLDTTHAFLTSRTIETVTGVAGGVRNLASSDWSWGDCTESTFPGKPDTKSICLREGFDPNRLYQLAYTGKDPVVLGLGLAAVRDVVAFFHSGKKDEADAVNPIAGQLRHTIGQGASQSGNLIRTFLGLGFKEDEDGRRVFDGVMPTIAARQVPINIRFGDPGGASSLYEPGSEGPVWWTPWPDEARHQKAAGLLDRCRRTDTCPLVMEVLGSSEFWSLRASPDFVGTDNERDIPLPANVRRYYIASVQHGGPGGFQVPPARSMARSHSSSPSLHITSAASTTWGKPSAGQSRPVPRRPLTPTTGPFAATTPLS